MRQLNYQFIAIIAMMAIATSCRREPMYDETGSLQMEIAIDYNIQHTSEVPEPEMMFVGLYDYRNGRLVRSEYTGPHGGEIYAAPTTYDIMVYNFDTEATLIRNNSNIHTAEAYTNFVPSQVGRTFRALMAKLIEKAPRKTRANEYQHQPVINEPDHLFAGVEFSVNIPVRGNTGTPFIVHADAATILETYALQIGPITGMEYIAEAEAYITGQAQSKLIASGQLTGEPSILYVPLMTSPPVATRADNFETTFRTFGKYPGADNSVILVVKLTDTGGDITVLEEDVTDMFDDPNNTDHNIVINTPVTIEKPTGGGLAPTVTVWDKYVTNIDI